MGKKVKKEAEPPPKDVVRLFNRIIRSYLLHLSPISPSSIP